MLYVHCVSIFWLNSFHGIVESVNKRNQPLAIFLRVEDKSLANLTHLNARLDRIE